MANRLVANLFIIDSSEGAGVGLTLPSQSKLLGIGFWAAGTSSDLLITIGNTTDTLIRYSYINQVVVNSGITMAPAWQYTSFGGGFYVQNTLRIGSLTAGTGYLYFG